MGRGRRAGGGAGTGYRIHVERNAPGFSGDFQQVVHDAAEHVKAAVDKVVKDGEN